MAITEICVWVLAALVLVTVSALVWSLWERDMIAKDLSTARAELKRLGMAQGQKRKPAHTVVIPAFRDVAADPEEFRRTQIRRLS